LNNLGWKLFNAFFPRILESFARCLAIWLDADIDQWLKTQTIPDNNPHLFFWGRSIMLDYVSKITPVETGLSTTFCGHTPDKHIRQKLSHLCLDTGAYKSTERAAYSLTIYEVHTQNWVAASYQNPLLSYGHFG
jgi:serine/threonine protein phosphatase 1